MKSFFKQSVARCVCFIAKDSIYSPSLIVFGTSRLLEHFGGEFRVENIIVGLQLHKCQTR